MSYLSNRFIGSYWFWHWGEGFQTVLFTWYMSIHLNLSATEIGFYQALVLSPFLIFTIMGGVLTDRIGARLSYTISTLIFAGILISYGVFDHSFGYVPKVFFLYCVLAGIVSAVSNPAIDTFIPEATPKPAQSNALLAATTHNLAKLTGTISALALPFLLAMGGFVVNGVLMALSAFFLHGHAKDVTRSRRKVQPHLSKRVLPRLFAHYRDCPENLDILLGSVLLGLVIVPAGYILWPLILRENFAEYGNWIALMNISSWIGAIAITAFFTRLSDAITRPGLAALCIWGLYGFGILALTLVNSYAMLCVLIMCLGGVKVGKALVYGKYLHNAPNEERGVLIAVDQTAFWGLATLGTFCMGALVDQIGLNESIYVVSGVVLCGVTLLALRGHLLRMTPA
jgi:MFS family permease